jgi:hypothetical protein
LGLPPLAPARALAFGAAWGRLASPALSLICFSGVFFMEFTKGGMQVVELFVADVTYDLATERASSKRILLLQNEFDTKVIALSSRRANGNFVFHSNSRRR